MSEDSVMFPETVAWDILTALCEAGKMPLIYTSAQGHSTSLFAIRRTKNSILFINVFGNRSEVLAHLVQGLSDFSFMEDHLKKFRLYELMAGEKCRYVAVEKCGKWTAEISIRRSVILFPPVQGGICFRWFESVPGMAGETESVSVRVIFRPQ